MDFDPHQVVADSRYAMSVSVREARRRCAPGRAGTGCSLRDGRNHRGAVKRQSRDRRALAAHKGATSRFEPLLSSSDQAELLPVARFQPVQDPASLLTVFIPAASSYTLARISGNVSTAFPGGPPGGDAARGAADLIAARPLAQASDRRG